MKATKVKAKRTTTVIGDARPRRRRRTAPQPPTTPLPMPAARLKACRLPDDFYRAPGERMTEIKLYGRLGRKFGRRHRFAVRSVHDAVQALDMTIGGFRAEVRKMKSYDFTVRVGKRHISESELDFPTIGQTIEVRPIAQGAGGNTSWIQIIAGVVLIAVGAIFTFPTAGVSTQLILFGIALVLGGVAGLIAGTPSADNATNAKNKASYQFGGAANVAQQGAPAALAYGKVFTGSIVGSAGIENRDITSGSRPASSTGTTPPGWGGDGQTLGAGGGGGEGGRAAKEDPDTLASKAYASIKDIIGEGALYGLVEGDRSIYLNDTPLVNPDGTPNFHDYDIVFQNGTQDQDYVPGFEAEITTAGLGTRLKQQFPQVLDFSNPNLDAIGIDIRLPRLSRRNVKNGDLHGSSVQIKMELNTNGAGWVTKIDDNIVGKASAPYIRSYRIDTADGIPGPWQVRITRVTADATSESIQNETYIESRSEFVYVKLRHPNTAIANIKFNAEQFPQIPVRTYHVYGLICKIPSNYNPWTGVRTGIWDGTWTSNWTCNPAWVLWDILTHNRYGLGNYVDEASMDKWAFERAAQHCDQLVPDGFNDRTIFQTGTSTGDYFDMQADGNLVLYTSGAVPLWDAHTNGHPGAYFVIQGDGNLVVRDVDNSLLWQSGTGGLTQTGDDITFLGGTTVLTDGEHLDIGLNTLSLTGGNLSLTHTAMERRYETHAYIAGREDAIKVISDLAGIFQASAAYISGQIMPIQDRFVPPSEYAGKYGPANVIDGDFNFSTGEDRGTINAVYVEWNDPADMGRPKAEYVDDQAEINRTGQVKDAHVTAFGCYSRGQAHRKGRTIILANKLRNEVLAYRTGLEGATHVPGDVVQLTTYFRAGASLSGRVRSGTTTAVTLDRPMTLKAGKAYQISVSLTDGTSVDKDVSNAHGVDTQYQTLNFTTAAAFAPLAESQWILIEGDLVPETFRVLRVNLIDKMRAELSCLNYTPSFYDAVDLNTRLEIIPPSNLPPVSGCLPPTGGVIVERVVTLPTMIRRYLEVSWTESVDPFIRDYKVSYRHNQGNWINLPDTRIAVVDVDISGAGTYDFQITARNFIGAPSIPLLLSHTVGPGLPGEPPHVTGLELTGQGSDNVFQERDAHFSWRLSSSTITGNNDGDDDVASGEQDPFFVDYEVRVVNPADDRIILTEHTTDPRYTFTREKNSEAMSPAEPIPEFRFEVRVRNVYNTEDLQPARLFVRNPPPPAPVNFSVIASFRNAFGAWLNGNVRDLASTEVYRGTTNVFADVTTELVATLAWPTENFSVGITTGTEYFFWLRAKDTFGNRSDPTAGAPVTGGGIGATDVDDFALDASNIFLGIIVLQEDEWQSNTPSPLEVTWNDHRLFFRGEVFHIPGGHTDKKYVFWVAGEENYSTSDEAPSFTDELFTIAANREGTVTMVWRSMANVVIGSANIIRAAILRAHIGLLAVDDARIESLSAAKISTGFLDAARIQAGSITADKFVAGVGESLLKNGNFDSVTNALGGWIADRAAIDTGGATSGTNSIKTTPGAGDAGVGQDYPGGSTLLIPVTGGQPYYLGVDIAIHLFQQLYVGIRVYTADKNPFVGAGTDAGGYVPLYPQFTNSGIPGVFQSTDIGLTSDGPFVRAEGIVNIPATCRWAAVTLRGNRTGVALAFARFDSVYFGTAIGNAFITALTAAKITSGTIVGQTIQVGANGILKSDDFIADSETIRGFGIEHGFLQCVRARFLDGAYPTTLPVPSVSPAPRNIDEAIGLDIFALAPQAGTKNRYTLDGTDPELSDPILGDASTPLHRISHTQLAVRTISDDGLRMSGVWRGTYPEGREPVGGSLTATPVYRKTGGTWFHTTVTGTIESATPGATKYWRLQGATTWLTSTPVLINLDQTIEMYANAGTDSEIGTESNPQSGGA